MTNEALARFVCPDDIDARSAFERYLDRVREEGSRGQGSYYPHTASRVRLERFSRPPRMETLG